MVRQGGPAVFGLRFLRHLGRLLAIYWRSPDAKWGALLLAGAIGLELGTVVANFLIADAQARILDAVETKEASAFLAAIGLFLGTTVAFLLASAYRIYVRQALEVRWREFLTSYYVDRWISPNAYCQTELHRGEIDNPDQRIAEDVRDFVASALGLSMSLLAAVASLVSFGGLLWQLSRRVYFDLDGAEIHVPGLLLWVAIAVSVLSMWITHLVGRRLVGIHFDRLRFEADFRYGLMRFRDNVDTVVFSGGDEVERIDARGRFGNVVGNFWQLIRAQRNLTLTTSAIGQANALVPMLIAAPAYFVGHVTLGGIAQIRYAYGEVSGALAWFVNAYQEIARWRANVERLSTFADVMDATDREVASGGIEVEPSRSPLLRLRDLRLEVPRGRVLLDGGVNVDVLPGDRIAVLGPTGAGKTMLLRAVAGVWPFGAGRIQVPERARTLFLPQRPYVPMGTLRAAVSFPAPEGAFPDERIREVLGLFDLGAFEDRLDEVGQWEQQLSPAEQQHLALARVLLHEPEWLFLDKATSALDEASEAKAYELLAKWLPCATVVSVAHRPDVARFHTHRWLFERTPSGSMTLRAA